MSDAPPALELNGIVKSFGPVQALRGADFSLAQGEVHALLGENGAGKSTLLHIAYGVITPDAGTLRVRGAPAVIRSPREARAMGLGMVHQHFTSIPALTVAENIALASGGWAAGQGTGRERANREWSREGTNRERTSREGTGGAAGRLAGDMASRLMEGLRPDALVETLSVALRQRLEIVQALATGAAILLLDEPSAVLAPIEVEALLGLVREFVAAGGAAALVTHKLREVFLAADRVTVLCRGVVTLSGPVRQETEVSLAAAMIGDGAEAALGAEDARGVRPGSSRGPAHPAANRPPGIRVGGIEVHPGELIGIAAVVGNGQRELLRSIAARDGVAFVPEDRTSEGLIPELDITENIVLGLDRDPRWSRAVGLDWRAARSRTAELIREFSIVADGPESKVGTLSGGNQQKVVLARALEKGPGVLVAENPTRGLDIRATQFVHQQLRAAAQAGMIVLVYSSDLDEVLELGTRVLVVRAGQAREAPRGADRQTVGAMMLGIGEP